MIIVTIIIIVIMNSVRMRFVQKKREAVYMLSMGKWSRVQQKFESIHAEWSRAFLCEHINSQRICNKNWQIKFQNSGRHFLQTNNWNLLYKWVWEEPFSEGFEIDGLPCSVRVCLLVCIDVKAMFRGIFRFKSNFVWSILFFMTHTSKFAWFVVVYIRTLFTLDYSSFFA